MAIARAGRDVGGHRDAAHPAMGHETEGGRILARQLDELMPHRGALLADARQVGGRVLHADDVLELEQPRHGVDGHVDVVDEVAAADLDGFDLVGVAGELGLDGQRVGVVGG